MSKSTKLYTVASDLNGKRFQAKFTVLNGPDNGLWYASCQIVKLCLREAKKKKNNNNNDDV